MDTVARFTAMYLRALDFMKKNKAETLVAMKKFYDKGGVVLSPSEMDAEYSLREYFDLDQQVALFDRSKGPSKLDEIHNRLAEFFKSAGTNTHGAGSKDVCKPGCACVHREELQAESLRRRKVMAAAVE